MATADLNALASMYGGSFKGGLGAPAVGKNAGGIKPGQTVSKQESQSTSGERFANPDLVAGLSNTVAGVGGSAASYYDQFLRDPASSPLFQNQLGTLLDSLKSGEAASRTALADQFREAGALNSGAFAKAATQNESDILGKRSETAVNLLGQSFGPTLQALLGGIGQINPLIANQKLSSSQATSSGSSESLAYPPSTGGGGGGGSISAGPGLNSLSKPVSFPSSPGYTKSAPAAQFTPQSSKTTPDLSNYNYGTPFYGSMGGYAATNNEY